MVSQADWVIMISILYRRINLKSGKRIIYHIVYFNIQ